jgi:hypothetical protein
MPGHSRPGVGGTFGYAYGLAARLGPLSLNWRGQEGIRLGPDTAYRPIPFASPIRKKPSITFIPGWWKFWTRKFWKIQASVSVDAKVSLYARRCPF